MQETEIGKDKRNHRSLNGDGGWVGWHRMHKSWKKWPMPNQGSLGQCRTSTQGEGEIEPCRRLESDEKKACVGTLNMAGKFRAGNNDFCCSSHKSGCNSTVSPLTVFGIIFSPLSSLVNRKQALQVCKAANCGRLHGMMKIHRWYNKKRKNQHVRLAIVFIHHQWTTS
jgi:hypothetical protein